MSACPPSPHLRPPRAAPHTWILLRGLTRSAGHWGDFATRCAQAWPGTRILTPELPGNGALHQLRSPSTVAALTEAVRQRVQQQLLPTASETAIATAIGTGTATENETSGTPGGLGLIAMSLGAMVACDWAQRHPQELAAAVLINTSLRPFNPFWQRLQPAVWPRLVGLMLRGATAAEWETTILQITSGVVAQQAEARAATVARWQALREAQPVRLSNAWRQVAAALRYRAPTQAPAVPMLVLGGARDQLVHPACSETLALRWQLAARYHPLAGHDLPLDAPDWVLQQIAHWLRGGA